MARGTEPTPPAAEGKKILVMTIRTTDPCKTLMKIAALQVLPDYICNYGTIKTVFPRKEIVVTILECAEVIVQQLPQRRLMWLPPSVNIGFVAPRHCSSFVLLTKVAI